ncbi:MAG TPA: alpha/beta hydrolase [Amnibacterium sp.]|jgi:pimeloyl-ACP methyl ester carboxylesterase|uniref:alpha/beta fold hydrolase n=1 Tax=Amnibacterium sp. TaxID=1872496 RepID=UPI002F956E35
MPSEAFSVRRSDAVVLAGERRGRPGAPAVVLLHANVADRRAWHGVLDLLEGDDLDLIAYDRRGFGETPPGDEPFTHLEDLVAVLDAAGLDRAVIVGNSYGGALALDLALTAPERVAGVLHVAGGASGMTDEGEPIDWELDPATEAVYGPLQRAEAEGDVEAQVRLLQHLWLDGPAQPEGRVGGAARELVADMNRQILAWAAPDGAGDAGLDVWHAFDRIRVPVTVVWGEYDVPADLPWFEPIVERIPGARRVVLPGVAHLPGVERPDLIAPLVREQMARS